MIIMLYERFTYIAKYCNSLDTEACSTSTTFFSAGKLTQRPHALILSKTSTVSR